MFECRSTHTGTQQQVDMIYKVTCEKDIKLKKIKKEKDRGKEGTQNW